jgi:hypothetical protein
MPSASRPDRPSSATPASTGARWHPGARGSYARKFAVAAFGDTGFLLVFIVYLLFAQAD